MDVTGLMRKLPESEGLDCKPIYTTINSLLSDSSNEHHIEALDGELVIKCALTHLVNVKDSGLHETILLMLSQWIVRVGPNQLSLSVKQIIMEILSKLLVIKKEPEESDAIFFIMEEFLNDGNKMNSSLVSDIVDAISHAQQTGTNTKCVKQGCSLLQKLIQNNMVDVMKCKKRFHSAVFYCLFHAVEEIRKIAQENMLLMITRYHKTEDYDIKEVLCEMLLKHFPGAMDYLFTKNQELQVIDQIKTLIDIVGSMIFTDVTVINGLLPLMEKAFKHEKPDVRIKAFECWRTLINNFSLSVDKKSIPRKLRLLTSPLIRDGSLSADVLLAKCHTWWDLVLCLEENVLQYYVMVCRPLIEFTCGLALKGGGITKEQIQAVIPERKYLMRIGCDILLRFLDRTLNGTILYSPRKTPSIRFAPLKKNAVKSLFPRYAADLFSAAEALIQEFANDHQMLIKVEYLLKLMGACILSIPDALQSEKGKNAVHLYSRLTVTIVKEGLLPAPQIVRHLEKFSKFPINMLTSLQCYVGDSCMMHGDLCLTIISLVLHPHLISVQDHKSKYVVLLQQLSEFGLGKSKCPLVYADSIIYFMKNQAMLDSCEMEMLTQFWFSVCSALYCTLQKRQLSVLMDEYCNQEFTTLCKVLTYPFEYIGSVILTKSSLKSLFCEAWSNLYCLFYIHVSGMKDIEINHLCAAVCSQLLRCLKTSKDKIYNVCCLALAILPIIVGSVGSADIKKLSESGKSPDSQASKNLMSSFSPMIILIKWLLVNLTSLCDSESNTEDENVLHHVMSCVDILNTFISKITLSTFLAAVLSQVAEPMSRVFELSQMKSISTKEDVHILQEQLLNVWNSLTTHIQQYYVDEYDSSFLNIMSPLLEITLKHPRPSIRNKSRKFWLASFGPNHSKLKFPPTMLEVIRKVKPPLISANGNCSKEQTSLTACSETQSVLPQDTNGTIIKFAEQTCSGAQSLNDIKEMPEKSSAAEDVPQMKIHKINDSDDLSCRTYAVVQSSPKSPIARPIKDKSPEPSPLKRPKLSSVNVASTVTWTHGTLSKVRKAIPVRAGKIRIDDLPSEDFVVINLPAPDKKPLTQRQKEAQKRRSFVPAMYNELSQNSCPVDSMDTSNSSAGVTQPKEDAAQKIKPHGIISHEEARDKMDAIKCVKMDPLSDDVSKCGASADAAIQDHEAQKLCSIKTGVDVIDLSDSAIQDHTGQNTLSIVPPTVDLSDEAVDIVMTTSQFVESNKDILHDVKSAYQCKTFGDNKIITVDPSPECDESSLSAAAVLKDEGKHAGPTVIPPQRTALGQKTDSENKNFILERVDQNPSSELADSDAGCLLVSSQIGCSTFSGVHSTIISESDSEESKKINSETVNKIGEIIPLENDPLYVKTRNQVLQHSGRLTRSKLKSAKLKNVLGLNFRKIVAKRRILKPKVPAVTSELDTLTKSECAVGVEVKNLENSDRSKTSKEGKFSDQVLFPHGARKRKQNIPSQVHSASSVKRRKTEMPVKKADNKSNKTTDASQSEVVLTVAGTPSEEVAKPKKFSLTSFRLGSSTSQKVEISPAYVSSLSRTQKILMAAKSQKISTESFEISSCRKSPSRPVAILKKKPVAVLSPAGPQMVSTESPPCHKSPKTSEQSRSLVLTPTLQIRSPRSPMVSTESPSCRKSPKTSEQSRSFLQTPVRQIKLPRSPMVSTESPSCHKSPETSEQSNLLVLTPILKRKSAGSPGKKVSFADPVVQGERLIEHRTEQKLPRKSRRPLKYFKTCPFSPVVKDASEMEIMQEVPTDDIPASSPADNSCYHLSRPPHEEISVPTLEQAVEDSSSLGPLQGSSMGHQPVSSVISLLTSPMWGPGLLKLLKARNINKVEDLLVLSDEDVKILPITAPKMKTLKNVLDKLRSEECENPSLVDGPSALLKPVSDMEVDPPALDGSKDDIPAASPIGPSVDGSKDLGEPQSGSPSLEGSKDDIPAASPIRPSLGGSKDDICAASPIPIGPSLGGSKDDICAASPIPIGPSVDGSKDLGEPVSGSPSLEGSKDDICAASPIGPSVSSTDSTATASCSSTSHVTENRSRQLLEDLLTCDIPDNENAHLVWNVIDKLLNVMKKATVSERKDT